MNDLDQADAPRRRFAGVAVGTDHTCGLRTDGRIRCWGWNEDEVMDPPEGRFITVTAGERNSCGLRDEGTVTCWGESSAGTTTGRCHPGRPSRSGGSPCGRAFRTVSAGAGHACGVLNDGNRLLLGKTTPHCRAAFPSGASPP